MSLACVKIAGMVVCLEAHEDGRDEGGQVVRADHVEPGTHLRSPGFYSSFKGSRWRELRTVV